MNLILSLLIGLLSPVEAIFSLIATWFLVPLLQLIF